MLCKDLVLNKRVYNAFFKLLKGNHLQG